MEIYLTNYSYESALDGLESYITIHYFKDCEELHRHQILEKTNSEYSGLKVLDFYSVSHFNQFLAKYECKSWVCIECSMKDFKIKYPNINNLDDFIEYLM